MISKCHLGISCSIFQASGGRFLIGAWTPRLSRDDSHALFVRKKMHCSRRFKDESNSFAPVPVLVHVRQCSFNNTYSCMSNQVYSETFNEKNKTPLYEWWIRVWHSLNITHQWSSTEWKSLVSGACMHAKCHTTHIYTITKTTDTHREFYTVVRLNHLDIILHAL